jgi:serine/threonine-protein kinase
LIGRTLDGRYRIIARLARGGMSTVYEAVDSRLDRLVAVKVMSGALSTDPRFSDRFSREARAAARLSHLNVVTIYDHGLDAQTGLVFLVMELVDGRTLRELLREHGRFSPAEAVTIMEPVLSALAAAHRAGLVHHDVKPENILLSDDGVVKVADFGLARAIESDAESTRTGLMMGTVAYCSPEQISKGQGNQSSDVYSAGIVLFELLTGRPPYTGETAMNVAYQHVHSRVPAPSSLVAGIPAELDELVVAATDSNSAGRPEDAAEFLADLSDVRARLRLPVVPIASRERIPYARDEVFDQESAPRPAVSGPRPTVSPEHQSTQYIAPGSANVRQRTGPVAAMPPVRGPGVHPTADMRGPAPQPNAPVVAPPKRPGKPPRTARQRARRRGLVALFVVVLLGLVAGGTGWWFSTGRYSKVPTLAGETRAQAVAAIHKAGYKLGQVTEAHDHTVAADAVISTRPRSGSRLQRGQTINLVVSSGKDMVGVPKLAKGDAKEQVDAALASVGLRVKYAAAKFSDTVPANGLLAMSPTAGKDVERGYTTVTVTLSKGPDWVSVPVIGNGASYGDVAAALSKAGLKPVKQEQFSDTVQAGQVILPLTPPDRQVRGGNVTVVVSKGPQLVTVPKIKRYSDADTAQQQLESLGLKVKRDNQFGGALGLVMDVNPAAGTQLHRGDTVTLTVF